MKLTDKTKKRLTLAGLGVLSVVLVVAIAVQFRTGKGTPPPPRRMPRFLQFPLRKPRALHRTSASRLFPRRTRLLRTAAPKIPEIPAARTRAFRHRSQNRPRLRRKRKRTPIRRRTVKRQRKPMAEHRSRIPLLNRRHRNLEIRTAKGKFGCLDSDG